LILLILSKFAFRISRHPSPEFNVKPRARCGEFSGRCVASNTNRQASLAMATDFNSIAPTDAWKPYAPDASTPWNRAAAAHLYRRFGLGATAQQLDAAAGDDPQTAVRKLLRGELVAADVAAKDDAEMTQLGQTVSASGKGESLSAWWLHRMIHGHDPALEKLTLFWHGHFATSAAKVRETSVMLAQHETLRLGARGKFEALVQAISRDPAMLIYLDSATNRKVRPNENYARELMELFCLGLGNYTEADIQQMARALTGYEVRGEQFRFNDFQFDRGEKTIFGKRSAFDGPGAVRLVVSQPACARFIATKLFRFYVADEPAPRPELIEPLAAALREHDFEIQPVLETIACSRLFYSPLVAARKVRSPVDLSIGFLRALEATTNTHRLAEDLTQLGQAVFFPPNVKGWDGGRAWLNSSTVLGRANLIRRLTTDLQNNADHDLASLAERNHASAPADAVEWFAQILLAAPISAAVRQQLIALASGNDNTNQRLGRMLCALGALPEFQLA
jgi:uncharacterized protein (DUF1800 family)